MNLAAIWRGEPGADLPLKPYDVLVIKPIPMWMEPGTIELAGEVRFPGKYPIHQGETLHSVLQRAGGFTDIAFPEGAVFIREELKKREKDQLELLANRLQSDLAALSLEAVASSAAVANSDARSGSASQGLIGGPTVDGAASRDQTRRPARHRRRGRDQGPAGRPRRCASSRTATS